MMSVVDFDQAVSAQIHREVCHHETPGKCVGAIRLDADKSIVRLYECSDPTCNRIHAEAVK